MLVDLEMNPGGYGKTFSYDFMKISMSAALTKNKAANDMLKNSKMYSMWLSRAGWTTSTKFPPAGLDKHACSGLGKDALASYQ